MMHGQANELGKEEKIGSGDGFKNILPDSLKYFFCEVADMSIFFWKFFKTIVKRPYEFNEILKQMFQIGYKSLFLVSVSSFIIGYVMTMHTIPVLRRYGAEAMVPNMTAIAMIREICPVITALVCSGKIGSAIGAEIGSMKVTEQINAMSISGVDPYHFLVVTRVVATSLSLPLLIIYSSLVALLGTYIVENGAIHMSMSFFISSAFSYFFFHDIIPTVIKSFIFGFTIGIIGCYYGYKTEKGAAGVGSSAHAAVVTSSLIIFFIDMLVVEIAHVFY
jgi:phospholipid/cholesterol/gamma-HCH transport system permease protein